MERTISDLESAVEVNKIHSLAFCCCTDTRTSNFCLQISGRRRDIKMDRLPFLCRLCKKQTRSKFHLNYTAPFEESSYSEIVSEVLNIEVSVFRNEYPPSPDTILFSIPCYSNHLLSYVRSSTRLIGPTGSVTSAWIQCPKSDL